MCGLADRQVRAERGADADRAVDLEPPAERLDPVDQAAQATSAGRIGAADAVVGDLDQRVITRARDPDTHD